MYTQYLEMDLFLPQLKFRFSTAQFLSCKNTLGNNFTAVKIYFPSEINVEKNVKFNIFQKILE